MNRAEFVNRLTERLKPFEGKPITEDYRDLIFKEVRDFMSEVFPCTPLDTMDVVIDSGNILVKFPENVSYCLEGLSKDRFASNIEAVKNNVNIQVDAGRDFVLENWK